MATRWPGGAGHSSTALGTKPGISSGCDHHPRHVTSQSGALVAGQFPDATAQGPHGKMPAALNGRVLGA